MPVLRANRSASRYGKRGVFGLYASAASGANAIAISRFDPTYRICMTSHPDLCPEPWHGFRRFCWTERVPKQQLDNDDVQTRVSLCPRRAGHFGGRRRGDPGCVQLMLQLVSRVSAARGFDRDAMSRGRAQAAPRQVPRKRESIQAPIRLRRLNPIAPWEGDLRQPRGWMCG
jgi:hypothetical protein